MKEFAGKVSLLIAIVATLQVVVFERFHATEPLKKLELCVAQRPDVIYFCDSSNAWIDGNDSDRRPISSMLDDLLADRKVGRIDGGAYHLELFEACLDSMLERSERPELLIVSVNLRSFSAEWDGRPGYSFAAAIQQIRQAENRLSRAIAPLLKTLQWEQDPASSLAEFKRTAVWDTDRIVGSVDDFENPQYEHPTPELVRKKFIFHYMYPLSPEHRKVVALRRIAQKAADHQVSVVFYVTPVDCQTGKACLGDRFTQHLACNVEVIRQELSNYPAMLIDMSQALEAKAFSWHQYPNEHLNEQGRQFVADSLATTLSSRYAFAVDSSERLSTASSRESTPSSKLR